MQVSLESVDAYLSAALGDNVYIPSGRGQLPLYKPTIQINLKPLPSVQLSGALEFTVQGTLVMATARLTISETEAEVAVFLAADQGALPAPAGLRGLHGESFGVEMGVFFEPPGIDLGLQGSFRIGSVQTLQPDQFAFVLEVIGEVPNLQYMSFYIDSIDLAEVVTIFTNASQPAILQELSMVQASDLSFHWADTAVTLPDGSNITPGFGFSGNIQIYSFGAHADVQVVESTGISGFAEMSPINLQGILRIGGNSKGIYRIFEQINGVWTQVRNNTVVQPPPGPKTQLQTVVAPGGPVIRIDTQGARAIDISCTVSLFDLVNAEVNVTIGSGGISFNLGYDLDNIERFDLSCTLVDRENFSANSSFSFDLDMMIGPIHVLGMSMGTLRLYADLNAALAVTVNPSLFNMVLSGGFDFEGISLTVPQFEITITPTSLNALPGILSQQIRNNADRIFAELFATAEGWADMIGRGVVVGIDDMATALKNVYRQTANEAAWLMRSAGRDVTEVAAGLNYAFQQTAQAAAASLRMAGYAAEEVARGLQSGFRQTEQGVASALSAAGFDVRDIAAAVQSSFNLTVRDTASVLRGIGCTVDQVGDVLHSVFDQTPQEATMVLHDCNFAVEDVAGSLNRVYGQTAAATANLLRTAGYDASDVGRALKNGLGLGVSDVAQALKSAGYAANEVGNFIKDGFGLEPAQLKSVLDGVGFAEDQTKNFFESLGGEFKSIFDPPSVGSVLHHIFSIFNPVHWWHWRI